MVIGLVIMALEWTLKALAGLIALIPIILALSITFKSYLRQKTRPSLFLVVIWISLTFASVTYVFQNLYADLYPVISKVTDLSFIWLGLAILALSDTITRDSIHMGKISAYNVLAISAIFFTFSPYPVVGALLVTICLTITALNWFYHCFRVYREAPDKYKRAAGLQLFGIFIFVVLSLITSRRVSGLSNVVPSIDRFLIAFGALLVAIAYFQEPRLAYILPFKVNQLTVFDSNSGTPIFNYQWKTPAPQINEELYHGMLRGLTEFIRDSVKGGNVQDIHLAEGFLLVEHLEKAPASAVLVATESTRSLREALISFVSSFERGFVDKGTIVLSTNGQMEFEQIVKESFQFIPDYD